MVASSAAFLREAELRLLRCTLPAGASQPPPPSPPPAHPLGPVAASALAAVELGDYTSALASAAPHILRTSASIHDSPAQFYGDLSSATEAFLRGDVGGAADEGLECRCALVLSAAVAGLLAFTQQNVTGPSRKYSSFPFWTSSFDEGWYSDPGCKWETWASDHLASFGSHVHGKFLLLQVRSLCDVLRIRWESTRSRTKQRALLLMENLVEEISKEFPVASERARLSFGVHMPTLPALRKEYGELLISCGLLGEALNVFKDLELWDNLIYCYRLSGKLADAVSLINTWLSITPNDPRLWCSLGDATNNDDHYKKALEVSNKKSARALRSLARSAYNKNDFYASKKIWESALALNSLHPDGWFAYGTSAWKDKDLEKAVDAFSRAVQIDPENGEAWNNIACLHMIRGKSQASVQAFREAVKFKRTSWELWENYSKVAFDTGNIQMTLEAIKMVLNLSFNKHFNVDLLDKVMTTLEEQGTHLNDTQDEKSVGNTSDDSNKETRQSSQLFDIIGNILEQIVQSGASNPEIWGLYARCQQSKGNLTKCSNALFTQVQYLQGSELFHDYKKFMKFAQASVQLCKVYMEISSTTGSKRKLLLAEMHLKSSLKQAMDFVGTEEYKELDECLAELQDLIGAT